MVYKEIIDIIQSIDAEKFRTKVSKEKIMKGKLLYDPDESNYKRLEERQMTDNEKVFAELKSRATDSKHEQALTNLYQEILAAFESNSSKGVAGIVGAKMQELHSAYNDAHKGVDEKDGTEVRRWGR